jgi:Fe-Mn family superoxide dismutase
VGSYTKLNSKPTGEKIMMTRRQAIKTTALASTALATLPAAIAQTNSAAPVAATTNGPFTLPPLPYAYDAFEPFIDVETMHIHHDKHHAAYVANLNKAVAEYPDLGKMPIEDLLKDLNAIPEKIRTALCNQGGGHYNHSLFWQMLKKDGSDPKSALAAAIDQQFGSFSTFKTEWTKAAISQFGSGWTWLVVDADKKLRIEPTANQDSPISQGKQPLLGIDVWEHAYYLKYQNRRPEYVAAFFQVINWDFVSARYDKIMA